MSDQKVKDGKRRVSTDDPKEQGQQKTHPPQAPAPPATAAPPKTSTAVGEANIDVLSKREREAAAAATLHLRHKRHHHHNPLNIQSHQVTEKRGHSQGVEGTTIPPPPDQPGQPSKPTRDQHEYQNHQIQLHRQPSGACFRSSGNPKENGQVPVPLFSAPSSESGPGRSVGVSVKMNNSTTRTRIDNLGGYHEYPYRAIEEVKLNRIAGSTGGVVVRSSISEAKRIYDVPKASDTASDVIMNEIRGYIPDAPIAITAIMNASQLFVRKCVDRPLPQGVIDAKGSTCVFEVTNDLNRRIFFLKQTQRTGILAFIFLWGFFRQTFAYLVMDRNGKPALTVKGHQYLFGVYNSSLIYYGDGTEEGNFLGQIKQTACDGSYTIVDEKKRVMFTLTGPVFACYAPCVFCCCDEEFEVFLSGSADEVGRVAKYWKKEDQREPHSNVGATFPVSLSIRSKAIVFGALITIRWQYFVRGGNGVCLVPLYLSFLLLGIFLYEFNCFDKCQVP